MGKHTQPVWIPVSNTAQSIHVGCLSRGAFSQMVPGPLGSPQQQNPWSHWIWTKYQRLKRQNRIIAYRLMEQQHLVQPSDQWLFPDNPDTFPKTVTAARLGTWIVSRRETILRIAQRWQKKNPHATELLISCYLSHPLIRAAWSGWDVGAKTTWFMTHTVRRGDRNFSPPVGVLSHQTLGTSHWVDN